MAVYEGVFRPGQSVPDLREPAVDLRDVVGHERGDGLAPWVPAAVAAAAEAVIAGGAATILLRGTQMAASVSLLMILLSGLGFMITASVLRTRPRRRACPMRRDIRAVGRTVVVWAFLLMIGCQLVFLRPVSPTQLVGTMVFVGVSVALLRASLVVLFRRACRLRGAGAPTLIVADAARLDRLVGMCRAEHELDVIGACTTARPDEGSSATVLGTIEEVPAVVVEHRPRVVLVAAGSMDQLELRRLCWRLEHLPVDLLVVPDIADVARSRLDLQLLDGSPTLAITTARGRTQYAAKCALDRALAGMLLILFAPVLLVSAVLIHADSKGRTLYRQRRIGRLGRPFDMLKLRTMSADADREREELTHRNDGNVVLFKMRDDPRVTRVGRVLRRYSIDELPQLWNVVRGEMSLVGPRPPLPSEAARYDDDMWQRFRVMPGMTGLWQVSGRSDLDWERTVRLDLDYADNWSIGGDLLILLQTFRAVVGGRGAY